MTRGTGAPRIGQVFDLIEQLGAAIALSITKSEGRARLARGVALR
jgi:hypothetical protein